MVAVVSGTGLGLFNSSLTQLGAALGGQAGIGQSRDSQYLNIATGNLLLTGWDESLFGRGLSTGLVRTYNSAGTFGTTGADGWQTGYERTVRLNTDDNTVERTTADGGIVRFAWDATRGAYVSTAGDGAHDTIVLSGTGADARWLWTEGSSQTQETYAAGTAPETAGRLERIADLATGAAYDFTYTDSQLTKITGAGGETLEFDYDEITGALTELNTREMVAGVLTAKGQVTYGYDTLHRLSWVQSDLTPDEATDNAWDPALANNDGKRFRTNYTYADATLRITGVTTSDGLSFSYTYDASGRVKTLTQGSAGDGSAQTLRYDYRAGETDVIDSADRKWTYQYDGTGQLIAVLAPTVNSQRQVSNYTYDTQGNVTRVSQAAYAGAATATLDTVSRYDANGNVILQRDRAGNTIERTYNAANKLLTETTYTTPDGNKLDPTFAGTTALPSGALVTRYVYDETNLNQLRFVINAAGEVSESQYFASGTASGQLSVSRRFLSAAYDLSGLATTAVPTLEQVTNWVVGKEAQTSRAEVSYDAQGRIKQTVAYATVDSTGAGELDAAAAITNFTYDAQGLLRQKIAVYGATRSLVSVAPTGSAVTDYLYDGLGRLLGVVSRDVATAINDDPNTISTTYSYLDAANQLRVTLDSGAVRIEARNRAGLLLSVSEADAATGATVTRTTKNFYDAAGRLRATQDATEARSYYFYDAAGRLTSTVDATGAVTETRYDEIGRAIQTVGYSTRVNTGTWLSAADEVTIDTLVYADTAPTLLAGQAWVDTTAASDRNAYRSYDEAGRLDTETDAAGLVTAYVYDGASRLLSTTVSKPDDGTVIARVTRYFTDAAGRRIGKLDAAGYLTESVFDAGGRLVTTVRYATQLTDVILRANGTLAELRASAVGPLAVGDQRTRYFYDGRGQQVGVLNAEGYLTEFVTDEKALLIDGTANIRAIKAYAVQLTGLTGNESFGALRTFVLAGAARITERRFNGLGQLITERNAEDTVTKYSYDEAGRLVRTESAHNTSEVRENFARYDVFGQLIGELSGQQAAAAMTSLAGKALNDPTLTEAQRNTAYSQFGTTHSYDLVGRRTESVDASGAKTFYFYDTAGRQTFTVRGVKDSNGIANAQGEVTETRYTAFGQANETLTYTGRITLSTPGNRASVQAAIATLSFVSANDTRRQYIYDQRGLLTQATDAESVLTSYRYTAFGQIDQLRRAEGTAVDVTTQYMYDARGLQIGRSDGVGTSAVRNASQTFDAFGRVVTETDALGTAITHVYDRLGRQLSQSRTVADRVESQSTSYDAFDRVLAQTDARGKITSYLHSDASRSVTVTSPEGVVLTTVHNRFGQTFTVSQPLPDGTTRTTTYSYDKNGSLLSTTNPLNQIATNTYDVRGLLAETADASGRKVGYTYDALGRVLSRIEDPGSGKLNLTTTYTYDGQGRRLMVTDATGRVTAMSYDHEGRLLQTAQDPSGLNLRTTYNYDEVGRQVTVTEGVGTPAARTVDYGYDLLGRRTSETVAGSTLSFTTSFAYDANDNLVTRTDALGNKTQYAYDAANRLRFAIDATGSVTENTYDANGNVLVTRTYAKALSAVSLAGLSDGIDVADIQILVTSQALADNSVDALVYRVIDKDARVRATVDGTGAVIETLYDTAGRVYGAKSYSRTISLTAGVRASLESGAASVASVTPVVDAIADEVTYNVLDANGQIRLTLDGANGLRETRYDASGRVLQVLGYATAFTDATVIAKIKLGTAVLSDFTTFVNANAAAAQTAWTVFDAAGRARFSVDLLGIVSETRYDAAGRALETLRYPMALSLSAGDKTALTNGSMTVGTMTTKVSGQQSTARASQNVYDNAGRVVYSLTTTGTNEAVVSERRYDAAGRVIADVAYAKTITYTLGQEDWQVARALDTAGATAANQQRLTQYAYDDAGRLRFTLDDAGAVTEQRYDAAGRVIATRQYLTPINVGTVSEMAVDAAIESQTNARQTNFAYDNAGRLASSTDALNKTESYGYDAAGRRTSLINKLGHVWTYEYDAAGRKTAEHSPAVDVAHYPQGLGPNQDETVSIVTRNTYDALGRLTARTENADADDEDDARTTQYVYDARSRQIKTIFPDAWQLDVDGKLVATGVRPESSVTYDALDRAVVQKDVRNNYAYKVYDGLGRLAYDVDEAGYVTAYAYNNFGEQTELTRFASTIDFSKLTGWTAGSAITLAKIGGAGVLPNSVGGRKLTIAYDRLGRKQTVTQPAVSYYKANWAPDTGAPVTQFTYDVYGNLVKEDQLLQGVPGTTAIWANTYRYYDELGRLTMVVDAEGYVTRTEYDAIGQVTEATECARAIPTANLTTTAPPLVPAAGDATTGYDRITRWGYDSLGRKISETVARQYQLSDGTAGVRDVVTKMAYDAVDHLTQLSVDGVETRTSYDVLGRVTAVQETERDVVRSNAGSLLSHDLSLSLDSDALYERASPYTTMAYDAFGNVIRTTRFASGLRNGVVTRDDNLDQTSMVQYDKQGRAVIANDGAGGRVHRRYDAADHVIESWYVLDGNDGRWQTVRTTAVIDAVGRQTRSQTQRETYRDYYGTEQSLGTVVDALENVTFNAFGEVVGKGFDGTTTPLQFAYDAAGRLTSSNADGGVTRNYGYNLAGHQLRESHQMLVAGNIVNAVTTQTADKLGRTTRIVLPSYNDTLANGSPINQRYDRWGNVIELLDPRGYQSNYEYNELNKVTREIQALVKVVSEAGVETWQRPEKRWYYDALGRLVTERDANGNLHRTEFDAVGRAIRMLDAYLHATRVAFDVLGNQRYTQDPAGHISCRDYDQLNRVISQRDFVVPAHSNVDRPLRHTAMYTLNQNGDRIAADGAEYDYDSRHLLIRSQTAAGVITGYEYDSQGRKVHEFNALSRVEFANYLDPVYSGGLVSNRTAVVGQVIVPIGVPETAFTVPSGESLKVSVEVQRYNAGTGLYETIDDSGLKYWSGSDNITGTVSTSGNYQIIVTATSWSSGKSVSRNISLVVGTASQVSGVPTLNSGFPDQMLTKDVAWSYQLPAGSFSDPAGQALTYSVSLRYWVPDSYSNTSNSGDYETDYESYELGYWDDRPLGAGDWIQFNASTRTFSGTPPQGGDSLLVISVTDTDGNMASTLLNVRVRVPSSGATVYDAEDNETVYQHEQTWNYDAFGRLTDHNDLSGVDYDYVYNATTGQATSQTNDWTASTATATVLSPLSIGGVTLLVPTTTMYNTTASRNMTYFANGLLSKLVEGSSTYLYAYDAAGNRTLEDSTTYDANGAAVHLRSRMTYDSHNRVERVIQEDLVSGKTVLDLTYSYDANGNRRRVIASGAYQDGAATISTPNRAPVKVGTPENLTLRSGVATTFRIRLADFLRDPDLDPLSISAVLVGPTGSQTSLPNSWLSTSIDATTGEMIFTAGTGSSAVNGTNQTIKLIAQDSYGATASVSFVLAVRSNSVPVELSSTRPVFPVTAGREVDLELAVANYFKDADLGDSLTLSLASGSVLPPGMTGGNTAPISSVLRFTGMPTEAGDYDVTIVATDQQNATATRTITFDVRSNHPPTAKPQPAVSFISGRETVWESALSSVFADSDGDALTLSATLADGSPLPDWLSFSVITYPDGTYLRLIGEPPAGSIDGAVLSVRLEAADTLGQTANTTLAITLKQNQAPQRIATLPEQQARVHSLAPYWLELPVENYFTDPEGDRLGLSLVFPPGDLTEQWLTLTYDAARDVFILSGTPTDNTHAGLHTFQIVATDASGANATLNVSLQVQSDNPPVYNTGIADKPLLASRNFSFTLPADAFIDVDGDVLIYSANEGTKPGREGEKGGSDPDGDLVLSWLSFDPNTRTFSGLAPGTVGRTYDVCVVVRDELRNTASKAFVITVVASTNAAPVYTAGKLTTQSAIEGQLFGYALPVNTFTDVNGDPLAYTAEILVGSVWLSLPQLGLSIDAVTGKISGAMTGPTQTSYSVKVIASDGLATTNGTFTLNVNRKPVLVNVIPAQSVVVNTAYSYIFPANTFSDPNGTGLTYSASGMPDGVVFTSGSRKFAGTPTSAGPATVTVTASDGVLSTSTTFTLSVTPGAGNQGPVVSLPIPDQTGAKGTPFSYTFPAGTFTDPDGNNLGYTAVAVKADGTARAWPLWLTFNPDTRTFSGTPTMSTIFHIKVTASDSALSVSDTFKITVAQGSFSSQTYVSSNDAGRFVMPADDELSSASTTGQVQQGYWFTYDGENRVKVVNGAMVDGAILTTANDSSYVLNYNAAGQVSSRIVKVNGADMLEVSQYDLRGQLIYVFQPIALNAPTPAPGTAGVLKEARYYDGKGRLVEQTTYYGNGETRDNVSITGWRKHTERYEFNADGQVSRQVTRGRVKDWTVTAGHTVSDEVGSGVLSELSVVNTTYDKLGRSSGYSYQSRKLAEDYAGAATDHPTFTHTYGISYQGRDSYLEKQVWGNSNIMFFKASSTQSVYDGWGRRVAIRESTPLPEDYGKIQDRIRYFSYDAEGMILRRREGLLTSSNAFEQKSSDKAKDELYAYANGQQVAKQTRGGNLELRTRLAAYQEAGGTGSARGRSGSDWQELFQAAQGKFGNPTGGAGSFDDAVTRLTDYTSNPLGTSRVQVNSGDTLQSLAQRVYGNSGLWYVLAEANAISSSSELIVGTSLRVPSVRVSANDAGTFKPYDPGAIIGSTAPGLPWMLPPTGLTCKQVGILVVTTIIRIVAAYYGGVTGAMIADAAMQKVEQNTGIRDHYSLGQTVAMGVMAVGGAYASTLTGIAQAAMVAATAATAYVAATEIDKARGEDVHFAWRNLLAAAATAVISNKLGAVGNSGNAAGGTVGAAVNGSAFSWGQVAADTVRNIGIAAVNKGVTQLITGKKQDWDMTLMVADAFGNSIGNAIVGELKFQKSVRNLRPDQRASYDEQRDYGRSRNMALLNAQNLETIQANTAAMFTGQSDELLNWKPSEIVEAGAGSVRLEPYTQTVTGSFGGKDDHVAQLPSVRAVVDENDMRPLACTADNPGAFSNNELAALQYVYRVGPESGISLDELNFNQRDYVTNVYPAIQDAKYKEMVAARNGPQMSATTPEMMAQRAEAVRYANERSGTFEQQVARQLPGDIVNIVGGEIIVAKAGMWLSKGMSLVRGEQAALRAEVRMGLSLDRELISGTSVDGFEASLSQAATVREVLGLPSPGGAGVANAEAVAATISRQPLPGPTAAWKRHVQADREIQQLASLKENVTGRLQSHADFATSSVINDQQVLLSQLSPKRQAQYLRGSMQPALEGKAIEKLWRNSVENDPFLMDYVSLGSKTKGPDFVFTGQLKSFGWGDLTTQRSWMDHVFRNPSLGYKGSGTLIKTR